MRMEPKNTSRLTIRDITKLRSGQQGEWDKFVLRFVTYRPVLRTSLRVEPCCCSHKAIELNVFEAKEGPKKILLISSKVVSVQCPTATWNTLPSFRVNFSARNPSLRQPFKLEVLEILNLINDRCLWFEDEREAPT